jgi:hypothetical protein
VYCKIATHERQLPTWSGTSLVVLCRYYVAHQYEYDLCVRSLLLRLVFCYQAGRLSHKISFQSKSRSRTLQTCLAIAYHSQFIHPSEPMCVVILDSETSKSKIEVPFCYLIELTRVVSSKKEKLGWSLYMSFDSIYFMSNHRAWIFARVFSVSFYWTRSYVSLFIHYDFMTRYRLVIIAAR